MAAAIDIAREFGVGIYGAPQHHFGMAANYMLQALDAQIGVAANASPAMPPWGGRGSRSSAPVRSLRVCL